jgi:hypothetical protein
MKSKIKEYLKELNYSNLEFPKCPYCDHLLEEEQYENIPYNADDHIFCSECGKIIKIKNIPKSLYTTEKIELKAYKKYNEDKKLFNVVDNNIYEPEKIKD